ncbi:MAG: phosphoribosylformylglycinamidine synthase, partial [Bacteroidales bacterium]
DVDILKNISERERAPFYIIGEVTGDHRFTFLDEKSGEKPIDMELADMFGNPPTTVLKDTNQQSIYSNPEYSPKEIEKYITSVLQMEAVACKDWLTNKVDRSVTGKIAKQQCAGPLQLPLNNLGAMTLDYRGKKAYATSIGHAPQAGLIDPAAGSVLSITEALTNLIWAPLADGLQGISLSANWMWPSKNPGEDSRLYNAVKAASDFALALGINIPTGKDSLSMTQKYSNDVVYSPGTVIISAAAEVNEPVKIIEPVLKDQKGSVIVYIDLSKDELKTGGSAFAQSLNKLGSSAPLVKDADYFSSAFSLIQKLIAEEKIIAGHDISAGGLITALLEMCFSQPSAGMMLDIKHAEEDDAVKILFSENPGLIIQLKDKSQVDILDDYDIDYLLLGHPEFNGKLSLKINGLELDLDVGKYRDTWYRTSYLLDRKQSGEKLARERFKNYKNQALEFTLNNFDGSYQSLGINPDRREKTGIRAAIIREKGVNGDREMAYALYLAGMDVKDVHMTDLISGRETLEDINMIVFVGGFSNSDVLGSAKGWAGAFKYNERARLSLENFYKRKDTLSLGVCNGCQLMVELDLVYPGKEKKIKMLHNESHKFESAFLNVDIHENNSVMLKSLSGRKLGIWIAHGEGRFSMPDSESNYHIPIKYSYDSYPGNPNGSDFSTAAICSEDGRHLAMMPHLERSFLPWQCGFYPDNRNKDEVTPWIEAFVNAREWIKENMNA